MNTFKGTPGELKINLHTATQVLNQSTIEVSTTVGGKWIAYVRGDSNTEAIATAKLFAAAPKMMEALQLCLKDLDNIIKNEFGEMEAADYPSIVKAKAALSAALD